ncbi:hypothetical protein D3C76_1046980 [compost metagenome]
MRHPQRTDIPLFKIWGICIIPLTHSVRCLQTLLRKRELPEGFDRLTRYNIRHILHLSLNSGELSDFELSTPVIDHISG